MNEKNDADEKKIWKTKKNDEDKNETLKGSDSGKEGLKRAKNRLKERLGYPMRDRSFLSNS